MHQQLWGYKAEDKLYMGARERKRLNITGLGNSVGNLKTHEPTVSLTKPGSSNFEVPYGRYFAHCK